MTNDEWKMENDKFAAHLRAGFIIFHSSFVIRGCVSQGDKGIAHAFVGPGIPGMGPMSRQSQLFLKITNLKSPITDNKFRD
jgi:hypothetical protein